MMALFAANTGSNLSLEDPEVMKLTSDEVRRAHTIKAAVRAGEGLQELTDFEYVQYALTHGNAVEDNSLETVLEHIVRMQAFREEYRIQETAEEGAACMDAVSLLQPGLFLGVHYLPDNGNCIAINDWAAFYPSQIKTVLQQACFMKASYYRFQCMSPTFLAIRQGMSNLFECEGASMQNYDARFQDKLLAELYISYPKRHKEVYFVNSPMIVNLAHSLWKKFMTQNMKDTFHLGHQIPGLDGQRIDGLFKTPTPEQARQHMVANVRQLLTVRYQYKATYVLPEINEPAPDRLPSPMMEGD